MKIHRCKSFECCKLTVMVKLPSVHFCGNQSKGLAQGEISILEGFHKFLEPPSLSGQKNPASRQFCD
jgi:hypothetical protein